MFGSLRPYFRKVARPGFDGVCSTDITVVRSRPGTDQRFLHYFIANQAFVDYATNVSIGTRMPRSNWNVLSKSEWPFPDLRTQRKIAAILCPYDGLIDVNLRRMEILWEMTRAVYREWFEHFRFPQDEEIRMVDSPLGSIPEGWKVERLEDIADVNALSIKEGDEPKKINYVKISSVSEGTIHEIEPMLYAEAPGRARRIVKRGDIIWSSVRPNLRAYSLILNPPPDLVVSTGFAVISARRVPYTYLYHALTTDSFVEYLVNHTRGAAYPAVNTEDFEDANILVPTDELLKSYDALAREFLNQKQNLLGENVNLSRTRDLLLPKLISGEIDTSDLNIDTEVMDT